MGVDDGRERREVVKVGVGPPTANSRERDVMSSYPFSLIMISCPIW